MEKIVMGLILDEGARMYERDERHRILNFQNAVQTGVARAFGGK